MLHAWRSSQCKDKRSMRQLRVDSKRDKTSIYNVLSVTKNLLINNLRTKVKKLCNVHDIGKYICGHCSLPQNSNISYFDKTVGDIHVCRRCFNIATGKTKRIEHVVTPVTQLLKCTQFTY